MKLLKLFCIIFWIITMALLLVKEGLLSRTYNLTYYDILGKKDPYREEYLGIYLKEQKIGFSKSYIDAYSLSDEKIGFRISNETRIFVKAFDEPSSIDITTEVLIDDKYHLKSFYLSLSSNQYKITAKGERKNDKVIVLLYSSSHLIDKREYSEKDFVFTTGFIPPMPSLKEGMVYYLDSFDPFGIIEEERIKMEIFKKTTMMYDDELFEVYPITLTYQTLKANIYTTPDGKILKAELPYGWIAKQEDERKARETKFSYPDISSLASIPSNMVIKEPRKVALLKVKIKDEIRIIRMGTLEDKPCLLPIKGYEEYTQETPFVQSCDKEIIDTAKGITKGERDSLKACVKIMEWVYENIEQKPIFSLPSAIEVLKNKKGDCNEHTILFTALTRSLGIPTKMITGLCYADGRFYYHAWASIFCGKWVSIDPTFNQVNVDATHIPLIEGDVGKQIGLLHLLGDIKIEVLDYGYQ